MTGLPNLHPLLVHFPIALLPVSVALDLLGVVTGRRDAQSAGRWMLWLGTLGAALAVFTGHEAAEALRVGAAAGALMATHHDVAMGVLAAAAALSLWRLVAPEPRWRAVYLVVAVGLLAALVVVSDLGGQMVFRHGVAVHT
jgi:uncharacterized membrane protein